MKERNKNRNFMNFCVGCAAGIYCMPGGWWTVLAGAYGMWEDKSWGGKRCMAKFQDGGGRSEISLTSDSVKCSLD